MDGLTPVISNSGYLTLGGSGSMADPRDSSQTRDLEPAMTTTWNDVLGRIIFDPGFRHAAETHPRELFTRLGLMEPEPESSAEQTAADIALRSAANTSVDAQQSAPRTRAAA
jgi:hypothetical protein